MNPYDQYLLDMVVRMAHHSTAIEGNTLTQGETKSIIVDNYIPRQMDLREFHEVNNYKKYLPYLLEHKDEELNLYHIKDTHRILLENIRDDNGKFKTTQNAVLGADFTPVEPYLVQEALKNWVDNLEYKLSIAKTDNDHIKAIMESHLDFELIHPFPDGNGRTGRALIVQSCFKYDIPAIIIEKDMRNEYINYLNTRNKDGLINLGIHLSNQERDKMNTILKFAESEINYSNSDNGRV